MTVHSSKTIATLACKYWAEGSSWVRHPTTKVPLSGGEFWVSRIPDAFPKQRIQSQLSNGSKLVKEMICYSQTKEERTLTGLALSVHMDEILVAGGGFEPPTFGL